MIASKEDHGMGTHSSLLTQMGKDNPLRERRNCTPLGSSTVSHHCQRVHTEWELRALFWSLQPYNYVTQDQKDDCSKSKENLCFYLCFIYAYQLSIFTRFWFQFSVQAMPLYSPVFLASSATTCPFKPLLHKSFQKFVSFQSFLAPKC